MYYIGLMSGTSVDAVDAALVRIDADRIELVATHRRPLPDTVRAAVHALCTPGADELEQAGRLDIALGECLAEAVAALLEAAQIEREAVRAVGSHGQTVRHRPQGAHPFSLQIGDPAVIAERTGITTVADFRPRDLAAGGQGAPLACAFHEAAFRTEGRTRAIVNIGGIANLTRLPGAPGEPVTGFDTGPGNTLLDAWARSHLGKDFDHEGRWARTGSVSVRLLAALLADPYFDRPPPKSTGREYFNLRWLDRTLSRHGGLAPQDVQATLCRLTAESIGRAVERHAAPIDEVYLCGGGVHNSVLVDALRAALAPRPVETTAALGVAPDWVEAAAFAWLAHCTLEGRPGNVPSVTGARRPVVLGAIWKK